MSVSNFFGAQGLDLLAQMLKAGGDADATAMAAEAANLKAGLRKAMWNGTQYCDGICSEVQGHSLMMTNMFALAFGMVPEANVAAAWQTVADWGIYKIGDYGSFFYQLAIGSGYYQGPGHQYETPGDGTEMLTALTKCDTFSWCSGLAEDNLTMTRESWHDGTYSHEWGTSAIVGTTVGIMGVHQTAPGFATFTVKPKLGSLAHATITVPTLRGYINVTATPTTVEVGVPCNTRASLCLPRSSAGARLTLESHVLLVDGAAVEAVLQGEHLCAARELGCGMGGAPRKLSAEQRV